MKDELDGKRILVLEDDWFIATDLARALRARGAVVIGPVSQPTDALAALADAPLDAAVLDINLGEADSYPVAERLAATAVPFLFVTGYDGWAMPERFRDRPRVAKPFGKDEVANLVAALITGGAA